MSNKILKSTRNKSKNREMITQNQQVSRQQDKDKQATGSRDTYTTKESFARAASSQRLEELNEITQQQNKDSN